MIKMNKNAWWFAGALAVVAFIVTRRKKSGFSNFSGQQKVITFTIKNTTGTTRRAVLFDAYGKSQQSVGVFIKPNIDEFNRTLLNEPKKVVEFQARAQGGNVTSQLDEPLTIYCKDASGQVNSYPLYVTPSAYQPRADIGVARPDNLVLSGNCEVWIDVNPNSAVFLTMRYVI